MTCVSKFDLIVIVSYGQINNPFKYLFKSYFFFINIQAFRIGQLWSYGQNISYEHQIELWNLENEQFEKLIIQPSLSYYNLYFEIWPTQTNGGLWWRNIWDRLEEDIVACLQIIRMPLGAFCTLCEKLQTTYG